MLVPIQRLSRQRKRSKMFYHLFAVIFLLFANGRPNTASPIDKMVKLAFGVSKSTYLPFKGNRFINKEGQIMGRTKSQVSFDSSTPDEEVVCKVGKWTAKSYEKEDTELILFKHSEQKLAVFGFRGTEPTSITDWKKNFDMELTKTSIGSTTFKIHRGFGKRYQDIAQWFEEEYQALSEDYTIVITGHSLGGALATLAAAYASGKLNRRPDAVITFASPKVGDKDFHEYYGTEVGCDRTVRITAKFDVFTGVPFDKDYTHVCLAMKVDGTTGWMPSLQITKNHSLYSGYKLGLARKFSNVEDINFGCDRKT